MKATEIIEKNIEGMPDIYDIHISKDLYGKLCQEITGYQKDQANRMAQIVYPELRKITHYKEHKLIVH